MLVQPVDVDVDLLIFVEWRYVVVYGKKTENEGEYHREETYDEQLFPC